MLSAVTNAHSAKVSAAKARSSRRSPALASAPQAPAPPSSRALTSGADTALRLRGRGEEVVEAGSRGAVPRQPLPAPGAAAHFGYKGDHAQATPPRRAR